MSKNLEDLDLKEVTDKTRIEPEFFQALMAKDFVELSKFNVKGFFKILNREYDLDLSDILEEYEVFLNKDEEVSSVTSKSEAKSETKVVTNVDQYSKESSSLWLWGLIVIVLAAMIWLIFKFDLLKTFIDEQNNDSASATLVQNIDEAQNNLKDTNANLESTEVSIAPGEAIGADTTTLEENQTAQSILSQDTQSAQMSNQTLNAMINTSESAKKEAIFSTDGKVWVGFIDLNTRTNSSIVTDNNFSVDLSKDQLLLIGGTALTLVDDTGEVQTFPAGNSKRFLVKDGKIKSITLSEFMSYNRGKEW